MKIILSISAIVVALFLIACSDSVSFPEPEVSYNYLACGVEALEFASTTEHPIPAFNLDNPTTPGCPVDETSQGTVSKHEHRTPNASFRYLTFEDALLEFATNVVIAQYVGHRPFGRYLTEFEFAVLENVLGNASDRIFVYAEMRVGASAFGVTRAVSYKPGYLTFYLETNYMLPLTKISQPHANTHDDGFRFIHDIIIDLDNPSNSMMYSESLAQHSTHQNFNTSTSKQEIVSFVSELTKNNQPSRDFIRSEAVEDIVLGSPYILVVEVDEPIRLVSEQRTTDWAATDIYYVTVVQAIKGDVSVGYRFAMIFLADAVLQGEQHIIATGPTVERSSFYRMSSRNSLFRMEQMDEIMTILGRQ